ncbi:MAG: hypothetical protein E6J41_09190 [Chloroflexi bacterium]|nr:MAG: hypothetical protein E6J41_09190 [Chloroflexota bacterium]
MAISTEAATRQKVSERDSLNLAAGVKVWRTRHFNTVDEAIQYANVNPAQQAGEFVVTDSPQGGGVDGCYFF